jgi:hypothetical protein
MSVNPFDRSAKFDFDLPPTSGDQDLDREALGDASHEVAREEALVQKASAKHLTESRAFGILAEFVEGQRQATINKMLLTPTTDANKDEHNYERGICHGLLLALKFAQAIADGAEATLEVFREEEKLKNAARTN